MENQGEHFDVDKKNLFSRHLVSPFKKEKAAARTTYYIKNWGTGNGPTINPNKVDQISISSHGVWEKV